MHQHNETSILAQNNSAISAEAALKFLPRTDTNNSEGIDTKDKDGFDSMKEVDNYVIEVAQNGFFITVNYVYLDQPPEKYIAASMEEVCEFLRGYKC